MRGMICLECFADGRCEDVVWWCPVFFWAQTTKMQPQERKKGKM